MITCSTRYNREKSLYHCIYIRSVTIETIWNACFADIFCFLGTVAQIARLSTEKGAFYYIIRINGGLIHSRRVSGMITEKVTQNWSPTNYKRFQSSTRNQIKLMGPRQIINKPCIRRWCMRELSNRPISPHLARIPNTENIQYKIRI